MRNEPAYNIEMQPLGDGHLQVSIPEIGASVIIESTRRSDAMEAAYSLIDDYLHKQQEAITASRTARPGS
jgi:hypothetical protein